MIFLIFKNFFVLFILRGFFPFKIASSFCFIVAIYFPKSLNIVIIVLLLSFLFPAYFVSSKFCFSVCFCSASHIRGFSQMLMVPGYLLVFKRVKELIE